MSKPNIEVVDIDFVAGMKLMKDATQAHWDEVPFGPWKMDLALDVAKYQLLEREGVLKTLLATVDGKPAGYITILSDTMLQHEGVYQAVTDAFYVDPAYRDMGVFYALVKSAEQVCRDHGITYLSLGVNPTFDGWKDCQLALANSGFYRTEITMSKRIE